MGCPDLCVVVSRLVTKVINIDVVIEVFNAEPLLYALTERIFKVDKATVPHITVGQIGSKDLAIGL